MSWYRIPYPKAATVGERKAKALRTAKMLGRNRDLDPVAIEGSMAATWWGKAWNRNLEGYADYSNRLPRGRSYARHGSVIDLRIEAGQVTALVQGSRARPYQVEIRIDAMAPKERTALAAACAGKLESAEALLEGRFPEGLATHLTSEKSGLFPNPRGIRFSCSCPDWADLCKHVAAALYGVGNRLDRDPGLFFLLRKIEMEDLVSRAVRVEAEKLLRTGTQGESTRLEAGEGELSNLFGIDLRAAVEPQDGGVSAYEPAGVEIAEPAQNPVRKRGGIRKPVKRTGPARTAGRGRPRNPDPIAREKGILNAARLALQVLDEVSEDLAGLEADLKSILADLSVFHPRIRPRPRRRS